MSFDAEDIIDSQQPAVEEEQPSPVAEPPAEEPVEETPAVAAESVEDAEDEEPEELEEPKKKNGVQKRIDKLAKERREAEAEAAYYKAQLAELKSGGEPAKVQAPQHLSEPDPANYDSYTDYTKALIAHEAKKMLAEERAQLEARQKYQSFQAKVASAKDKMPDFETLVTNANLPITQTMAEEILDADNGVEVAYYLGKNPDEAERIAKLPEKAQVKEIFRLEARLAIANQAVSSKPKKTASGAPAPIAPLKTSVAETIPDPGKDLDAWMDYTRKQRR